MMSLVKRKCRNNFKDIYEIPYVSGGLKEIESYLINQAN